MKFIDARTNDECCSYGDLLNECSLLIASLYLRILKFRHSLGPECNSLHTSLHAASENYEGGLEVKQEVLTTMIAIANDC